MQEQQPQEHEQEQEEPHEEGEHETHETETRPKNRTNRSDHERDTGMECEAKQGGHRYGTAQERHTRGVVKSGNRRRLHPVTPSHTGQGMSTGSQQQQTHTAWAHICAVCILTCVHVHLVGTDGGWGWGWVVGRHRHPAQWTASVLAPLPLRMWARLSQRGAASCSRHSRQKQQGSAEALRWHDPAAVEEA